MDRRDFSVFSKWSFDLMKLADENGCNIKVNDRGAIITHPKVEKLYVRIMHDPRKPVDRHNMERGLDRILRAIPKEKDMGTPKPATARQIQERCEFCGPLKDGQTIKQHNALHQDSEAIDALETVTALRELLGVSEADKHKMDELERENIRLRQQLQASELELNELKTWKRGLKEMLGS